MTELPKGWERATVNEVAALDGVTDGPFGSNLKTEHYTSSGPRVVRLQNIGSGIFRDEKTYISAEHFDRLVKHSVQPDDVLVASLGEALPRACLAPAWLGRAIVKADCIRIRPGQAILPPLLMWALNAPQTRERVSESIKGVGRPRINLRELRALELPVPPLAEQERIVAALEEAFSKLDAGDAGLRTARRLLKRMREAILAAAVTGRLVPHNPTDTPADRFLAGLGIEWIESNGVLPALPEHWAVTALGGIAHMSLGKMLDAKAQTGEHSTPYLRNVNVRWGWFDLRDLATMDVRPDEFDRVAVVYGDLVVCEGGEPGRCAVWKGEPVVIQKALHRVRPTGGVSGDYLALVLAWWTSRPEYDRYITGTTIRHVPKEKLRLLPVPLAPPEEQRRIVAEVERQVSFLEACERVLDAALGRSAALRQSVLKAAFDGRLVPQDSTDEPASVLLERIRAERASAPKSKDRRARSNA